MNNSTMRETPIPSLGLYSPGFTVGVAYDTFSKIFSIYYNHSFVHINVECDNTRKRIGPLFIEGTGGTFNDNISINFGQNQFTYDIPQGYQPWNTIWKVCSCINKVNMDIRILFYYFLVTLKH